MIGSDLDLIFIPGQSSHPLRSWRIYSEEDPYGDRLMYKCWIKEILMPDLKEKFPQYKFRILALGYDSKGSAVELADYGIPDRSPHEIA